MTSSFAFSVSGYRFPEEFRVFDDRVFSTFRKLGVLGRRGDTIYLVPLRRLGDVLAVTLPFYGDREYAVVRLRSGKKMFFVGAEDFTVIRAKERPEFLAHVHPPGPGLAWATLSEADKIAAVSGSFAILSMGPFMSQIMAVDGTKAVMENAFFGPVLEDRDSNALFLATAAFPERWLRSVE